MKSILSMILILMLSACSTVKETAGGFVDGASKDIKSLGTAGEKLADKIRN
jgi:uncharacterized lipoprotein